MNNVVKTILTIICTAIVTAILTVLIIYGGNKDSAFVNFFRGDETENIVGAGLESSTKNNGELSYFIVKCVDAEKIKSNEYETGKRRTLLEMPALGRTHQRRVQDWTLQQRLDANLGRMRL